MELVPVSPRSASSVQPGELPEAMGVFFFFLLGLGKRGVGWAWEASNLALMRQSGVRQAKLWLKVLPVV